MLLQSSLLLSGPVLCLGHGAMIWPPTWQDRDGEWIQQPGAAWMQSGVTGYLNDKLEKVPEIFPKDSEFRTYCTAANSRYPGDCDYYAGRPWLAPGAATPWSPCGIHDSSHVDGRALPGNTRPVEWRAGSVVEAKWALYANHGGGYQYRLCPMPASGDRMDLTEDCFQQHVLRFAVDTVELQNAKESVDAPRHAAKALRTSNGTLPHGYDWAVNPIPAFGPGDNLVMPFPPLYPGACGSKGDATSDECPDRIMNWRIIDQLQLPNDLKPGEYVISLRWDAESTPQVWSSCGDVVITSDTVVA